MRHRVLMALLLGVVFCAGFSCSTNGTPPGVTTIPQTVTDDSGHTATWRTVTFSSK